MKDNITERELALIRAETVNNHMIKQGINVTVMTDFLKGIRKAVEDDKKVKLAEASNPHKKSWQDNKWAYIGISIAIGIVAGVASYIISKLIFG